MAAAGRDARASAEAGGAAVSEPHDYESISDADLQKLAAEKGLYVATDKFEHWYLQILNLPKDGTMNPHMVMVTLLREEIVRYLYEHEGEHREMTPAEYMRAMGHPPEEEEL
jgi:hypothetical protein